MDYSENVQLVLGCGFSVFMIITAVGLVILFSTAPIWVIVRYGSKEWMEIIKKFKTWTYGQMGIEK